MRSDTDTSTAVARVLVTAHGWPCVQRILVLLTARAYVVSSFEATPSVCEPYWHVGISLHCGPAELRLLQARLERIPSVAAVVTAPGTDALVPARRSWVGCGTPEASS